MHRIPHPQFSRDSQYLVGDASSKQIGKDDPFVTISDAPHYIELDLKRSTGPTADDGYLQIWVDNAPSGSRAGLDNSATLVDFVRMGGLSVKTGAAGTLYWDEFKSKRGGGLIGP